MEMMDKQAKIHIMGHRGIVGVTYILCRRRRKNASGSP